MRGNISPNGSTVRRPLALARAVSRYDLVLAVIPLAISAGVLLGATGSVPEPLGVGGGGVVALTATAYALFGDPPIDPSDRRSSGRGADGPYAGGARSGGTRAGAARSRGARPGDARSGGDPPAAD